MSLRYYQQEAVDAAYRYCQDNPGKNPCIVLPTGAGKTHVIVKICHDVQEWQGRVLVLAHVKELLSQAEKKLKAVDDLDVGVYSASLKRRDVNSDVLVAGVQSVFRRGLELSGTRPFNLVIVDEAHRIPVEGEGMYVQLLNDLKAANPKLRVIGLTATPYRTGDGFVCREDHFLNDVCYEANIKELIAGGFLCSLVSKRSKCEVDMSGVKVSGGDFVQAEMEQRFGDEEKVSQAVDEILRLTESRNKVLIFCCGIAHASEVAFHLSEAGQKVRIVSSEHSGRDAAIEDFQAGSCKYLVNVNCLTEGFDATAIDAVVLLRATVSPGLYYQMVGRGLRVDPSKDDCLVLDFGGNVQRHGTIDNLKVKPKAVGNGDGDAPVKACPQCETMVHAGLLMCPECGHEFPPPAPNHDATASDDSPLATVELETWPVTSVGYSLHVKRGADENAPRTMRVTYYDGTQAVADEWVCIEHSGFAYEKAFSWWFRRSNNKMPNTVPEAVELANAGALIEPTSIQLRRKPGEKFSTIVHYELGEKQPEIELINDDWVTQELGEVPF